MKKNLVKKLSIGVASLALVAPLALGGLQNANAAEIDGTHYSGVKTVRPGVYYTGHKRANWRGHRAKRAKRSKRTHRSKRTRRHAKRLTRNQKAEKRALDSLKSEARRLNKKLNKRVRGSKRHKRAVRREKRSIRRALNSINRQANDLEQEYRLE